MMQPTSQGDRALFRIGAVALILGAIVVIVAFLLHPRTLGPGSEAQTARMIAQSGLWIGTHVGVLLGFWILLGGVLALGRSITGAPAEAWAWLARAAALVSAAAVGGLSAVDGLARKTSALAVQELGSDYAATVRDFTLVEAVNMGFFGVFVLALFGVTLLLLGVALAAGRSYPQVMGWLAIVLGLVGGYTGLHILYRGDTVFVQWAFPIVAALSMLWFIVMAFLLWGRARQPGGFVGYR